MPKPPVGSFRGSKLDELTHGRVMILLEKSFYSIPTIEVKDFSTNCDSVFLSNTKLTTHKGTCLPLAELHVLSQRFLGKPFEDTLLDKLHEKIQTANDVFGLSPAGKYPIDWYYKPPALSFPSVVDDYKKTIPENYGFETVLADPSKEESLVNPQESSWMRRSELTRVLLPILAQTSVKFGGYIGLSFSETIDMAISDFKQNQLYVGFTNFLQDKKHAYICYIINYNGHWTSCVYSKQSQCLFYFNSQQGDLSYILRRKNLVTYSYDTKGVSALPGGIKSQEPGSEGYCTDYIYRLFDNITTMRLMIINKENCQIDSAECGMYAISFIYLFSKNVFDPKGMTLKRQCLPYHYFKYAGDKTMAMNRSLFFDQNRFSLKSYTRDLSKLTRVDKSGLSILSTIIQSSIQQ